MKNLIKKLSSTNISKTYMFILLGVSALMMVGYFSYAWFTVQGVQKYSVVTGNLTGTLAIGSNTVTINGIGTIEYTPSTDDEIVTISVTNSSDRTVKNSLYYYNLDDDTISLGYISDSSTIPSVTGVEVAKGKSLTYKVRITGANGKTIRIGSSMGLVNSNLSLPNGASVLEKFGLSVSETLLAGVGANGTINTDDSEQTFITGTDPNNYIWYSGKLWRAVSIDPSDNSVKLVTQWNISSIPYNARDNGTFQGSYMEQWLNDTTVDGFLENLREPEKFIKTDSEWNATKTTDITKPEINTIVTDAVGLLNTYEYTMSYNNATSSTGYLNNGLYWWTLTPYSDSEVSRIAPYGENDYYNPNILSGCRPAINLKPEIRIVDGDGTSNNPYRLQGDNDSPVGTLLSTRYSGEYISFGTEGNNLYQIVSHENGTGTKITSSKPLKSDAYTYLSMTFGSLTFENTTIGKFLNNDYLTSDIYLTGNQADMIEDTTTWYEGNADEGTNYKDAKYQDENQVITDTFTAKVGLLRIGELMAGQFTKYDNTSSYWLLTPSTIDYSYAFAIGDSGGGISVAKKNSSGVRPTMNLKQNVVITGGNGTESDPFTLSIPSDESE